MLSELFAAVSATILTQSFSTNTSTAIVIAVIFFALALFTWQRSRALQKQLTQAKADHAKTVEEIKASQIREREITKKSDERNTELQQLKKDLAAIRKKNHTTQEEAKSLKSQLRTQAEQYERKLASRPAFSPVPSSENDNLAANNTNTKSFHADQTNTAKVEPITTINADKPSNTDQSATISHTGFANEQELKDKIIKLEQEHEKLTTNFNTARETINKQKGELSKLHHYAEQLRRIDIISKGKVETLEDKVSSLGRQYYEAISELALLKGEVALPTKRSNNKNGKNKHSKSKNAKTDITTASETSTAKGEIENITSESDSIAMQINTADSALEDN
ncbi:MAG: hypothetical protein JW841_06710 [Deltaproteobacteria bacterium]|nr:hypothetical protein [Deltaproteobacteria bacterium]